MEWFRSGLPNFVVVVRALKPYQAQVVQMRLLHEKWSIKFMILFWITRMRSAWDSWDRIHLNWAYVFNILHTHLCMRKLCARSVPWLLKIDQKRIRVTTSEQKAYFNRNPKKFLRRLVTIDETWIHHYTPESSEGSKQCVKPGKSAPKRPKMQQSAGKVMSSVFWDAHWVIFIDYLEKGRTITGACMLHYWID